MRPTLRPVPYDVIIVGAGLGGCSVASFIAPERSVLVLDQGEPGAEASAQNAGMVRRLGEDPYERILAMRTHDWLCAPGDDWADLAPSRRTGAVLALAHEDHHLHDAAAHAMASGVRIEELDAPASVAPALAGSRLRKAWWLPDERVADPWSLVSGFLRRARRHGAVVHGGEPVLGLVRQGDRITGVRTPLGTISAGSVVLAAGAWSAGLALGAGLRRPLIPLRRTLLQTEPHPLSSPEHPWCWVDDVGIYARPEGGGWLVSGCDEEVSWPSDGPGSRGPVADLPRALAADKLARWMPALGDVRFRGGWTGLRTFAPDRRPLLGSDPDLDGLWWAAGLGGFGVTCSYAIGEAVGSWLLGQPVPWLSQEAVSPGRLQYGRWLIRPEGDLASAQITSAASGPPTPPDRMPAGS